MSTTSDEKSFNLYNDIVKIIKQTSFSFYYSNTSKHLLKYFPKEQLDYVNFCFVDRSERFADLTTRNIRRSILNDNIDYLAKTLPCEIYKTRQQLKQILLSL